MDIFALPVHPHANLFTMYPQEKLDSMAENIKKVGLLNPILIGKYEGTMHLIDGRNRREACKIADIVPETKTLNGQNMSEVIIGANIENRDITKGQKAMAYAVINPDKEKGGRGKTLTNGKSLSEQKMYSQARTILTHLPDDVPQVLSGELPFSKAYSDALESKTNAAGLKERRDKENAENTARKTTLEAEDPIRYQKVVDDVLSLKDAWTLFEGEQMASREGERNRLMSIADRFKDSVKYTAGFNSKEEIQEVMDAESDRIMGDVVLRYFPNGIQVFIDENRERYIHAAKQFILFMEVSDDKK